MTNKEKKKGSGREKHLDVIVACRAAMDARLPLVLPTTTADDHLFLPSPPNDQNSGCGGIATNGQNAMQQLRQYIAAWQCEFFKW